MREFNVKAVSFDDEDDGWDFIEDKEHWFLLDDRKHVGPGMMTVSPTPGKICFLIFEEVK
jgi:hypothetical protein